MAKYVVYSPYLKCCWQWFPMVGRCVSHMKTYCHCTLKLCW